MGEGLTVGVALDGSDVVIAQNIPADLPDNLSDALHSFFSDRDALTAGMSAWLSTRVGPASTARIAQALEEGIFFREEAMSATCVLTGQVALAPALDDLGDGAWWFAGDGPPEGWDDNPGGGIWGWPIHVADLSALRAAQAPYLPVLARLASDLAAADWTECDACGGVRPTEDEPCLDGCAVDGLGE